MHKVERLAAFWKARLQHQRLDVCCTHARTHGSFSAVPKLFRMYHRLDRRGLAGWRQSTFSHHCSTWSHSHTHRCNERHSCPSGLVNHLETIPRRQVPQAELPTRIFADNVHRCFARSHEQNKNKTATRQDANDVESAQKKKRVNSVVRSNYRWAFLPAWSDAFQRLKTPPPQKAGTLFQHVQ